jgi:hypothetical protein
MCSALTLEREEHMNGVAAIVESAILRNPKEHRLLASVGLCSLLLNVTRNIALH